MLAILYYWFSVLRYIAEILDIMRFVWICCFWVVFSISSYSLAQIPQRFLEESYEAEPKEIRVQKAILNGQYIPKDIADAVKELDKRMDDDAKKIFAALTEEESSYKAFMSFGRWMMIKWGMEEGSRLTAYFESQQIGFVEDMIRILMVTYHRHLNGKPTDPSDLFEFYRTKRQKEYQEKLKKLMENSKPLPKN